MKRLFVLFMAATLLAGCQSESQPTPNAESGGGEQTASLVGSAADHRRSQGPQSTGNLAGNETPATDSAIVTPPEGLLADIEAANDAANRAQQAFDFKSAVKHWQRAEELLQKAYPNAAWQVRSASMARKMAEEQAVLSPQQKEQLRELFQIQQEIGEKIQKRNYTAALRQSESAREQALQLFPADSVMMAKQTMQLARLNQMAGNHDVAIDLYRESMTIQAFFLRDLHPDLESLHAYLGECFLAKKEMMPAIENLKTAARMAEQMWGSDSLNYAMRANDLGVAFHQMRDLTTSLKVLRAAESIRRQKLGMDHPQVAHSLINMATVYIDLNRNELARQCLEQALPILKENLGGDNLMVIDCQTKLAMTLMLLDEPAVAEPILEEVLAACQRIKASPATVANSEFRLGVAQAKQAKYEPAEGHLRNALNAQEIALGANHAATVRSKNALATLYRQTGQIELAERLASEVKSVNFESDSNAFQR